jgi:hypothetical protein
VEGFRVKNPSPRVTLTGSGMIWIEEEGAACASAATAVHKEMAVASNIFLILKDLTWWIDCRGYPLPT